MSAGNFSKILVAIDGSEISLKAAEYGITMAKKDNAKLVVIKLLVIFQRLNFETS